MASTSTLHKHKAQFKLRLLDITSKTSCTFALNEKKPRQSGQFFSHEGIVHEGHCYELQLLSSEDIGLNNVSLSVNDSKPTGFSAEVSKPSTTSQGGSNFCCYNLVCSDYNNPLQLFKMTYGFATVEVFLHTRSSGIIRLSTKEIACACHDEGQKEIISKMLDELTADDASIAMKWMLDARHSYNEEVALNEVKNVVDSSQSLRSYLKLCKNTISVFVHHMAFFQTRPFNKLMQRPQIVKASAVRHVGRGELEWLSKNSQVFYEVSQGTDFKFNGKHYMPSRISTNKAYRSFDISENRSVLSFANYVCKRLGYIVQKVEGYINELYKVRENLKVLNAQNAILPSLLVIDALLKKEEELFCQAQDFKRSAIRVFRSYEVALQGACVLKYKLPKRSKIFQEVLPYADIYGEMVKWEQYGNFDMLRDGLVLSTWRIDKLYEYYALFKLLEQFAFVGFKPDYASEQPMRMVKYAPNHCEYYDNEKQICNFYALCRGSAERIRLFYEPVIYGSGKTENGVDLYRTTKTPEGADSYWTPDYYIYYQSSLGTKRFILDAKFKHPHAAFEGTNEVSEQERTEFNNCLQKYKLQTLSCDFKPIDAMWLLCGRAVKKEIHPWQNSSWVQQCMENNATNSTNDGSSVANAFCFAPDGVASVAPGANELATLFTYLGVDASGNNASSKQSAKMAIQQK